LLKDVKYFYVTINYLKSIYLESYYKKRNGLLF